jgi:hypothetical protein
MMLRLLVYMRSPLFFLSALFILFVFSGALAACSSTQAKQSEQNLPMAGVEFYRQKSGMLLRLSGKLTSLRLPTPMF